MRGVDAQVALTPDVDRAEAAAAGRRASETAQAAAAPIELPVRVDQRTLSRAVASLTGLGRSATSGAGGLAAVGTAGIAAASGLAGAASALAGALPLLGQLAAVAATASGALAALPGALAAVGAIMGTVAIGTIGLGDAMAAVASGDAAALEEALANLAPAAQEFVRAIADLRPAFDDLRLDVQQRLFDGLATSVTSLAEHTLPTLRDGLGSIADLLNNTLIATITQLDTETTQLQLAGIFDAAFDSVARLGDAVPPLAQALLDTASVGADVAADLARPATEALIGFADMVSQMAASGELRQLILDGLDALRQLGGALADVGGIISGVFSAAGTAGGGGILGFLDSLNETVNSVAGQEALSTLFSELGRIGQALQPVLLALGQGIGTVAGAIADIAEAAGPVLAEFIPLLAQALASLAPGFIALAPVVAALGEALVPLGTILADLVVGVAPGVAAFLSALGDGLAILAPVAGLVGQALADLLIAVAPLLPILGTVLAEALILVGTLLSAIATGPAAAFIDVLGQLVAAAAGDMLPVLMTIAEQILPVFADASERVLTALEPLIPVLAGLARQVAGQIADALPDLAQAFGEIASAVTGAMVTLIEAMVDALIMLAPQLPTLVNAALGLALAMADFLVALVPMLPLIAELLGLVLQLVTPLAIAQLTTLMLLLTAQLKVTEGVIRFVITAFQDTVGAVKDAVDALGDHAEEIKDFFLGLPGRILGWLGDLGGLLFDAGKDVIRGLTSGIRDALPNAADVARDIGSSILDAAKGALGIGSPSKLFAAEVGRWIPAGIAEGVRANAATARIAVADTLDGVTGTIAARLDRPSAGASPAATVVVDGTGLPRALAEWLRHAVRTQGGGSVQRFAGQPA